MIRYKGEHGQLVGIRLPAKTTPSEFDHAYDICSSYFRHTEIVEDEDTVLIRSELAWEAQQDYLTARRT